MIKLTNNYSYGCQRIRLAGSNSVVRLRVGVRACFNTSSQIRLIWIEGKTFFLNTLGIYIHTYIYLYILENYDVVHRLLLLHL